MRTVDADVIPLDLRSAAVAVEQDQEWPQDIGRHGHVRPGGERTQEANSGAERRLATLFDELDRVAVFELDVPGRLTRLGLAWKGFTGFDPPGCLGRLLVEYLHPDHRERVERALAAITLDPEARLDVEVQVRTAEGRFRWVHLRLLGDYEGHRLGSVADLSPQKDVEGWAGRATGHDHLTGLPNRMLFLDRLRHTVAEARRGGDMVALLSLDIDGFKAVNDSAGHMVGDELLKAAAHRLARTVRDSDMVARIGSDEFALLQTGLKQPSDAAQMAQRLIRSIRQRFVLGAQEVHVGCSVGVALFPWDGADPDELLRRADLAVDEAKQKGGGVECFYDPEVEAALSQRRQLEEEIYRAFELHQFDLHFQPAFDLRTGKIVGAEALLRWNHPERGMIPPATFIPVAEACGAIRLLGPWVVQAACKALRTWEVGGLPPITLGVNISAVQFRDGAARDTVETALSTFGLDPSRIEIEVTETAMFDAKAADAREQLLDLRRLGINIAVDDFGTGFGSLVHLRDLPVSKIKIDQSFVQGAPTRPSDAAIVRAIAALGRSLDMRVQAEGVETAEQFELVREAGCTEAQGYYHCRPLPQNAFTEYLRKNRHLLAADGGGNGAAK